MSFERDCICAIRDRPMITEIERKASTDRGIVLLPPGVREPYTGQPR